MFRLLMIVTLPFFLAPSVLSAQSITENWLRVASVACGGGVSADVQGEFQAQLLRRLKILDGEIGGEGAYTEQDLTILLETFSQDERLEAYQTQTNCLLRVLDMAAGGTNTATESIVLDAPFVPDLLQVVPSGKDFLLNTSEAAALGTRARLVGLTGLAPGGGKIVANVNWSDAIEGTSGTARLSAGQALTVGPCTVVVYAMDLDEKNVSLTSYCN